MNLKSVKSIKFLNGYENVNFVPTYPPAYQIICNRYPFKIDIKITDGLQLKVETKIYIGLLLVEEETTDIDFYFKTNEEFYEHISDNVDGILESICNGFKKWMTFDIK